MEVPLRNPKNKPKNDVARPCNSTYQDFRSDGVGPEFPSTTPELLGTLRLKTAQNPLAAWCLGA